MAKLSPDQVEQMLRQLLEVTVHLIEAIQTKERAPHESDRALSEALQVQRQIIRTIRDAYDP